jgi:lipopolysaccharide/colanic/teichoic acid biosynthesis glycosyltransferase
VRSVPLWKRIIDGCLAAVLITLLAGPMLVIAIAIKVTSPGPVFFRQVRLGRGGAPFHMWKFRTMVDGAERLILEDLNEADGLLFKIRSDPRVTAVGRLLRRWSLDEFPQLVNVLCGDMSVVGPRPLPVAGRSVGGRT